MDAAEQHDYLYFLHRGPIRNSKLGRCSLSIILHKQKVVEGVLDRKINLAVSGEHDFPEAKAFGTFAICFHI